MLFYSFFHAIEHINNHLLRSVVLAISFEPTNCISYYFILLLITYYLCIMGTIRHVIVPKTRFDVLIWTCQRAAFVSLTQWMIIMYSIGFEINSILLELNSIHYVWSDQFYHNLLFNIHKYWYYKLKRNSSDAWSKLPAIFSLFNESNISNAVLVHTAHSWLNSHFFNWWISMRFDSIAKGKIGEWTIVI